MKKYITIGIALLVMAVSVMTSCTSTKQLTSNSNPNRRFVLEDIPIHVRASADHYHPQGGPQMFINDPNFFVEVINDVAYVCLPYIGRIYQPVYTFDGTSFQECYKDLKVERTRKDNGSIMSFKVTHDGITYGFSITLYDGGKMDMIMQPNNGQMCSYSGTWDESQLYDANGNPLDRKMY